MAAGRTWYEVRVREKVGPDKWVKKSKFFLARDPGDAAAKYHGPGAVIHSCKVDHEKLLGVGSFFRLGDELLKELKRGGDSQTSVPLPMTTPDPKDKKRTRRYHERREKEATT